MTYEADPRDNNNTSDGGGNDFPDIHTNDSGQATQIPTSPNEYPDIPTNDIAQKSDYPDFRTKGGGMQTTI